MISKRVQGFTESVIREMTRVSAQYGGVNLAQGFPNFPPPRVLVEAAHRALDGEFHQYAITWGARNLREAIAQKFERFYGHRVDPERQVTVCCGSTEAMLSTYLLGKYHGRPSEPLRQQILRSMEYALRQQVRPANDFAVAESVNGLGALPASSINRALGDPATST